MADKFERVNFGRARLVTGFALLAIGLFIGLWTWNTIDSFARARVRQIDNINVGPGYPIWLPLSWEVLKVPVYLLQYLVLGVFITTVGITIVVPPLWKLLARSEIDEN